MSKAFFMIVCIICISSRLFSMHKNNKNSLFYGYISHFISLYSNIKLILTQKALFSSIFLTIFTPMKETLQHIKESLSPIFSQREINSLIKIIFENLKGYSQVDIIMHSDDELSGYIKNKIDKILSRLLNHEPIQYILGEAYFQGFHLKVTPSTLIPRPETEQLVDIIIRENSRPDLRILDIGTGSGAIAIALARALHFPQVDAIDISSEALIVAKENAKTLKANVNFILKDILNEPAPCEPLYDIIVSNPPYITHTERTHMEPNVLDYEPHSALFVPDSDPLLFYRAIAKYADRALSHGGRLYFEINRNYGKETAELLSNYGFEDISIEKDMYANDRFVSATKTSHV